MQCTKGIRNVAVHRIDTDSYGMVRAAVMPRQRQDREYKTAVATAIYTGTWEK